MIVETLDLRHLPKDVVKQLLRLTFRSDGWMFDVTKNILRGYREGWDLIPGTYECKMSKQPLNYNRGTAFIAKEGETILGWALVRHPERVRRVTKYGITAVAGYRPDFMVYVRASARKRRVAKSLLFTAYNSYGKLDVYPHDSASRAFYNKYRKMSVRIDTNGLASASYSLREI